MSINWPAVLEHFLQGFTWGMGACLAFFLVLLFIKWKPLAAPSTTREG